MSPPARRLPALLRFATLTALVGGAVISWAAARDVAMVLTASTLEPPAELPGAIQSLLPDPKKATEATQAAFRSQVAALESMRGPRLVILLALSTSAALVFVAGLRLRWPSGIPRPGVARMLGSSAIVSAVLRTLDGAQLLVVTRRSAASWDKVMANSEGAAQLPPGFNLFLTSALSVGVTVVVASAFVALGYYFRSPGVAALLEEDDRQLQRKE